MVVHACACAHQLWLIPVQCGVHRRHHCAQEQCARRRVDITIIIVSELCRVICVALGAIATAIQFAGNSTQSCTRTRDFGRARVHALNCLMLSAPPVADRTNHCATSSRLRSHSRARRPLHARRPSMSACFSARVTPATSWCARRAAAQRRQWVAAETWLRATASNADPVRSHTHRQQQQQHTHQPQHNTDL
jgi:hypothetical protein